MTTSQDTDYKQLTLLTGASHGPALEDTPRAQPRNGAGAITAWQSGWRSISFPKSRVYAPRYALGHANCAVTAFETPLFPVDYDHSWLTPEETANSFFAEVPLLRNFLH